MANQEPSLEFPDLIEDKIIEVITKNIPELRYKIAGEPLGTIPKQAYPLTVIFIAGDDRNDVATEMVEFDYVGYVAVDVMQADKVIFDGNGVAKIKSYVRARAYIRQIQRALAADGLSSIFLDSESVLQLQFEQNQYGEIERDSALLNRAILPFTIKTQAVGTDC